MLTGKHVLFWLIGVFAVVIGVNALFVVKALDTYPGEDVQNPYMQGIAYNHTIAAHAAQTARGWRATIAANRTPDGATLVSVVLESKASLPSGFALTGELRHPADAERDRNLVFARHGNMFVGQAGKVTPGAWDVLVHAKSPMPFEASRRLWLR